jgi:hypothetical protein
VILVALLTLKDMASSVPNFTLLAPVKLLPVMVTDAPWHTLPGAKVVMTGNGGGV